MKRAIPIISLGIIFGVAVSFMERVFPSFNLYTFNAVDFKLLSMLLSIFLTLLLILFSKNILTAILSLFAYAFSFVTFMLYAKIPFGYEFYVRIGIIVFIGIFAATFLFFGRKMRSKEGTPGVKVKGDIAFPIIFFLVAVLMSMAVVLFEQRNLYDFIPIFFYSYLYFLIISSVIISFFSFNDISGFLIGFFSVLIYFLMNRLIINNFDIYFLLNAERNFALIVLTYAVIFGICTSILAYSSSLLLNGIVTKRASFKMPVVMPDGKPAENPPKKISKNDDVLIKDTTKVSDENSSKEDQQIAKKSLSGKSTRDYDAKEILIKEKNKESKS